MISIGNLSVGGSGKTPLVSALAPRYEQSAVVLRGYGRRSEGLVVVKDFDSILCDVEVSGDEAMIYAHKLVNSIVIVSEVREDGILKAKELGAKIVFLDDGYGKHHIKKLDFLIEVSTPNQFCLPSGAYRERLYASKKAIFLKEERDFKRSTTLINPRNRMSLVTAIARPQRLDKYLPEVLNKHYFSDHYFFTKEELKMIIKEDNVDSLLVTYKDLVKILPLELPTSLLDLELEVEQHVFEHINNYIKDEL